MGRLDYDDILKNLSEEKQEEVLENRKYFEKGGKYHNMIYSRKKKLRFEKYVSLNKDTKKIKLYVIRNTRLYTEPMPDLFIGIGQVWMPEWYEYIKKTSIKIYPLRLRNLLKDIVMLPVKYMNLMKLEEPKEFPTKEEKPLGFDK